MTEQLDPSSADTELRSHVKQTMIGLVVFCLLMAVAGTLFAEEIEQLADGIFEIFGVAGLLVFICLNDTIISPIPPDVALVVLSHSPAADHWLLWVSCFGFASSLAGILGWLLGKKLRGTKFPAWLFGAKLASGEQLMRKYGMLSVAIGALTPVPYSLTTWSAGMLNAPFRMVFWPSLLRVARFLVYYLVLNGAFKVGERL